MLYDGLRAAPVEELATRYTDDLEPLLNELIKRVEAAPSGVLRTSYENAVGDMFCALSESLRPR